MFSIGYKIQSMNVFFRFDFFSSFFFPSIIPLSLSFHSLFSLCFPFYLFTFSLRSLSISFKVHKKCEVNKIGRVQLGVESFNPMRLFFPFRILSSLSSHIQWNERRREEKEEDRTRNVSCYVLVTYILKTGF